MDLDHEFPMKFQRSNDFHSGENKSSSTLVMVNNGLMMG